MSKRVTIGGGVQGRDDSSGNDIVGAPPTTFDPAPGTMVDRGNVGVGLPGTVVDGGNDSRTVVDGSAGQSTYVRVVLPPGLAGRFRLVREIPGGAEADILEVADAQGDPFVVKLYRAQDREFDPLVLNMVQAEGSYPHVVKTWDWGVDSGQRFELQELVTNGSLEDLRRAQGGRLGLDLMAEILPELTSALEFVHDHEIVHRDLKPQNVLVRSFSSLDLVLSDFGLAVSMTSGQSRTMRSGSRTPAYAAPEASWGQVSPARDWWSVGIMIVELLAGHPFRRPDGDWMEDPEIGSHLATREIDVSGIEDRRWAHLARGLLVRDPRDRWGATQVNAWLAGEMPEVVDTAPTTSPSPSRARTVVAPFPFDGSTISTPKEMAATFSANWTSARRIFAGVQVNAPDAVSLMTWLHDHGEDHAKDIVMEGGEADRRLSRFIVALDPDRAPSFAGEPVGLDSLMGLAQRASTPGDDAASDVVRKMYDTDSLGAFAACTGQAELGNINAVWRQTLPQANRVSATLPTAVCDSLNTSQAKGHLAGAALLASCHPDLAADIRKLATQVVTDVALEASWFATFVAAPVEAGTQLARDLIAIIAAPIATSDAIEARSAAEQKREEARRTAAEAERAASEAAEANRRQVLAVRVRVTRRGLFWPAMLNLLVGVSAFGVMIQRTQVLELWAKTYHSPKLDEWVRGLIDLTPRLALCLPIAIAMIGARRYLRNVDQVSQLTGIQALSVVGTLTAPLTIPVSLWHAFAGAREIARAERVTTGTPGLRRFALIGGFVGLLTGVGIVVQRELNVFEKVQRAWPSAVTSFYAKYWPDLLRPERVVEHTDLIVAAGVIVMLFGIGSAHASYRHYSPVVKRCEQASGLFGIVIGALLAPVVVTGIAYAAIGIGIAIGAVVGLVAAIYIIGFFMGEA